MPKLPKVIYIMGPPGAGKGTQAEMLAEKVGYKQFSTGNAFREVSARNSDLGRRVKETIDNGYLAPPEMAAEIVMTAVKKHLEKGEGLVFDGTPRTEGEAKIVDEFFEENNYGVPLPIYLEVDREEMERRNSKRVFCLDAEGGDFPVFTEEDKVKCEEKSGHEGRRLDDDPEKFVTRWDEFQSQTHPVIENYKEKGILHEVDGMPSIEEVHGGVMEVVNSFER